MLTDSTIAIIASNSIAWCISAVLGYHRRTQRPKTTIQQCNRGLYNKQHNNTLLIYSAPFFIYIGCCIPFGLLTSCCFVMVGGTMFRHAGLDRSVADSINPFNTCYRKSRRSPCRWRFVWGGSRNVVVQAVSLLV